MRNKYKDADDRFNRCEGPTCSACLADDLQDFMTVNLSDPERKWHKGTPGTDKEPELTLCEECHAEFLMEAEEAELFTEATMPSPLTAGQSDWAREWCLIRNVLAFVPARDQLRDMGDVREWFECLSRFLAWHCDESFENYVFGEGALLGKGQIFTTSECKLLDQAMEKAMEICAKAQCDSYAVGTNSMRAIGALTSDIPEQDEQWETSETDTTPDQNAQLVKIALFVKGIAEMQLESERDIASEDAIAERNQMIEDARGLIELAKAVAKGAK
jgi:hypothetical protein